MRIGIYIRVSTDEQAEDGYSLAAQERICRGYVEAHSLTVGDVYIDEGLSGTRSNRPALLRLREDVQYGRIKGIVVHKLDRLARNLRLLPEIIEDLKRREAIFASVTEQLDFSTPLGWAMFQVQGAFAEMFSRNLASETAKGLREKAEQGLWGLARCHSGICGTVQPSCHPRMRLSSS
jgi:site-specific DNA recombinase